MNIKFKLKTVKIISMVLFSALYILYIGLNSTVQTL